MKILILVFLLLTSACSKKATCHLVDEYRPDTDNGNVLSIGDSISQGYWQSIPGHLTGNYDMFHIHCNGTHSYNGADMIEKWLANKETWDAVVFNHGIWDSGIPTPIDDYKANLKKIGLAALQKTPNVFFVTTTDYGAFGTHGIADLNTTAIDAMNEIGVTVVDLSPISNDLNNNLQDGVHHNSYGADLIAQEIASYLNLVLP